MGAESPQCRVGVEKGTVHDRGVVKAAQLVGDTQGACGAVGIAARAMTDEQEVAVLQADSKIGGSPHERALRRPCGSPRSLQLASTSSRRCRCPGPTPEEKWSLRNIRSTSALGTTILSAASQFLRKGECLKNPTSTLPKRGSLPSTAACRYAGCSFGSTPPLLPCAAIKMSRVFAITARLRRRAAVITSKSHPQRKAQLSAGFPKGVAPLAGARGSNRGFCEAERQGGSTGLEADRPRTLALAENLGGRGVG